MFGFEQFSFEMVAVFALGLIVLGPKDLPVVMRRIGQFVGKMRGMAAEFRASFDELARQSEIDELRKEVEALRTGQFGSSSALPNQAQTHDLTPHDYNPYDNASSGLDGSGFGFPAEPPADPSPIMGEGVPVATAEAPTKPARKPRAKKAAPVEIEPVAEAAPPKPRRARAKPAPQAEDAGG
jgi:sec-independent protein translocase protein TatB